MTGASSGIGAEFARRLAERGHEVVLVARRRARLETLAEELGTDRARIEVADLSLPETPPRLSRELGEAGVVVDYLVNGAGSAGHALCDGDWEPHRRYLELMTTSVAAMCHFFVPPMVERGYGRVVNVASVAGLAPIGRGATYGPAKRYVVALSEELNAMVAPRGVHVCALCPGFTRTEFHDDARFDRLKARLPTLLWCDVETVVADGMRAVENGASTVVSGRLYRWGLPIVRSRILTWLRRRRRSWRAARRARREPGGRAPG